jgi:hypothetical protein
VSFDTDLQLDPLAAGISAEERAARAAHYITGTAHPDPAWDGKLQFSKQHDQGVVVLDAPASSKWPGIVPAKLPPVGFLDRNQGELKNETFTLVGYGVDIGDKKAQIIVQFRSSTTSYLKNVGREVITFQINGNDSKAGGGSCFGDSGAACSSATSSWGRVVCQLLDLQRARQLPARRHRVLARIRRLLPGLATGQRVANVAQNDGPLVDQRAVAFWSLEAPSPEMACGASAP